MNKFSLIKQLGDEAEKPSAESTIDYQQYELVVEGTERIVNIPQRAAADFEQTVAQLTERITNRKLRSLLREFRGTRT